MPRPSGTWAMPRRAIASGERRAIRRPAKVISPLFRTVPEIARSVVVLPAPFAPSSETACPSSTDSETPWRALIGPYRASTSSSMSSAIARAPIIRRCGRAHYPVSRPRRGLAFPCVTRVDWIALGLVALTGLVGLRKGLVASLLAITGIVAGAVLGARAAPLVLHSGAHSAYAPLVALGGAVIGAAVLEALGSMAGPFFRAGLRFSPLRAMDTAGGLVLGAAAGLALVWVFGAAALLLPGQRSLRESIQRSELLRKLNDIVPPEKLLHALARVDPFPSIAGPAIPLEPPSPEVVNNPVVRAAAPSIV